VLFGPLLAKVLAGLSCLSWGDDPGGVTPIAGFTAVPTLFTPVATPLADTTPWPVNIAAWLVAAIVGLP
jgi:hypothetical protein